MFGAYADEREDPDVWEEIAVIADLSLRIQRVSVQATGKVIMTLVWMRTRWLSLTHLTDRDQEKILDMPMIPGLSSVLLLTQERGEAVERGEVLEANAQMGMIYLLDAEWPGLFRGPAFGIRYAATHSGSPTVAIGW